MTVFYEGDRIKKRPSGKELLAEMASRTDPVHWRIMARLRDECSHEYPKFTRNNGQQACCGCSRTAAEIGARKIELVEAAKAKPEWIGWMENCEICRHDSSDVRTVRWHNDGELSICWPCRENHDGEWTSLS